MRTPRCPRRTPTSRSRAAAILANKTLPWDDAVGDQIGLFPINFLDRAEYYGRHPNASYSNASDLTIAHRTAAHYILGWPLRLKDGTFSRTATGAWAGETSGPGGTILWGDDQTMGTLLCTRLAPLWRAGCGTSW